MISRRQIIRGQPADERSTSGTNISKKGAQQVGAVTAQASSSSSSSSSKPSSSSHQQRMAKMIEQQQQQHQIKQQQLARQTSAPNNNGEHAKMSKNGSKMNGALSAKMAGSKKDAQKQQHQQQGDSSDGYLVTSSTSNPYEDYVDERSWRQQQHQQQQQQQKQQQQQQRRGQNDGSNNQQQQDNGNIEGFRQHFDPYSIYSDEEDVWYSEERLFEDHLEEIYNKWPMLDDDIWCKLIIMERNRRIGKAYARVPVVTINGSHELSYDGEKLALNGFDNIDRDEETEECRKRIGKGIKIKVDNIGNILIKRLSKAGVYVKEWINPSQGVSGGSSNSTNGSSGAGVGRSMPSRQQLIKAASMNGVGANHHMMTGGTPTSSSGGSSMDMPNDTAICDEVITIGGRLELDKIYVMFDIKKFQANITQELCRSYPDRRKLEQQCFSIVGLTRDSEDILNLPCWVMVINIVAIEMLNARFPTITDRNGLSDFPDSRRLIGPPAPSFVSIFEHAGNTNQRNIKDQGPPNKEEDPYSLPANASSSDVKSSINDYGTASTKNMSNYIESAQAANHSSRFYGTPKNIYPQQSATRPRNATNGGELMQRHRSKSNYNIYGQASKMSGLARNYPERYNNNSSIYSPGHMLIQPTADQSVPPKLPPRDFVSSKKNGQRSKSSSNVNYDDNIDNKYDDGENIYSTGLIGSNDHDAANLQASDDVKAPRKTKKNRFLESLKSPLSKSSGRATSVVGTPTNHEQLGEGSAKKVSKSKSGGFSKAKNLRSFLGVGSKSKESASDDSNYVHLDDLQTTKVTKAARPVDGEADSVVDSNEEIDDSHQVITNSTTSPTTSYNDLDIPTPDYETDENIYAIDHNGINYNDNNCTKKSGASTMRTRHFSTSNNETSGGQMKSQNKDDLYYSGFSAHVPHNQHPHHQGFSSNRNYQSNTNNKYAGDDRLSCISSSAAARANSTTTTATAAANSRYLMRTSRMLAAKMSGREIYGSTLGLQQPSMTGSRYRSASMQRYYPSSASSRATSHLHHPQLNRSHNEMYDPDLENPYAMSAGLGSSAIMPLHHDDSQGHYGVTTAASCIGGPGRRRSVSKQVPVSNRSLTTCSTNHYDIGRSSSGIYGNNSSSSSSEYADWHPQVRKVNSSGYLNSIFKGRPLNKIKTAPSVSNVEQSGPSQVEHSFGSSNNNNNISNNNNNNSNNKTTRVNADGYHTNPNGNVGVGAANSSSQVRNYATSRSLKSTEDNMPAVASGATMPNVKRQQQQQQMMASSVLNGPAYRAYDSSNDSDPSYTNSSDGLDIYDQIGANTKMGHQQQQHHLHHHHQNQYMAPEVQVGEWENMYDR